MGVPEFPFQRAEHSYEPPQTNADLRQAAPVSKVKLFDGSDAWVVMKHKDVCNALASDKLSAVRLSCSTEGQQNWSWPVSKG